MSQIPVNKNITAGLIDAWHEQHQDETPRPYMGISMLGHECPRYLWLMFRSFYFTHSPPSSPCFLSLCNPYIC